MFSLYIISYPNVWKLLEIIFSNTSNSVVLKKCYSMVKKLCLIDRNLATQKRGFCPEAYEIVLGGLDGKSPRQLLVIASYSSSSCGFALR